MLMIEGMERVREEPVLVEDVLAYVGNSEKKCVIQWVAKPGESIDAPELNDRFADCQEPPGTVRYGSTNNLSQTVTRTHSAAGALLASESLQVSGWWMYKPVDSRVADAVTGYNLGLAAEYGLSLEELWGKTSTNAESGQRSPQTRLLIFDYLSSVADEKDVSIRDIADNTGIDQRIVHRHIQKLHQHGFLQYEAETIQQQQASFEITADPDPNLSTQTRYGRRVRQRLHYNGVLSMRAQVGYVLMGFQDEGIEDFSYQDVMDKLDVPEEVSTGTLALVVSLMLREGVLKRQHKSNYSFDDFSKVYLDPMQREIIDNISRTYQGLRAGNPDVIEKGVQLGQEIMSDKTLVRELLERAYDHSFAGRKKDFALRAQQLLFLIGDGELSTREIQRAYNEAELTIGGVGEILRRMRNGKMVQSRKDGNEVRWQVTH